MSQTTARRIGNFWRSHTSWLVMGSSVVGSVRLGFQGQKLLGTVDPEIKVTNLRIVRNYLPIDTASIPASLNIRHTAVRTSYLANFGTLGVVLDLPNYSNWLLSHMENMWWLQRGGDYLTQVLAFDLKDRHVSGEGTVAQEQAFTVRFLPFKVD